MDAGSIPAASTNYKGPDDLRALFLGPIARVARSSGPLFCGCRFVRTPEVGHIPGQSRSFLCSACGNAQHKYY